MLMYGRNHHNIIKKLYSKLKKKKKDHASTEGGTGSISGQGTIYKIPHAMQCSKKKKIFLIKINKYFLKEMKKRQSESP